jgi:5-formyltetrahydrofolate cyclo-ligase
MTVPQSSDDSRKLIWAHVYQDLLRFAIPDSRFNYDFMSFTPDFRGSEAAVHRVTNLLCYKSADTILVTCDNSLESLRLRALQDGKKLLVGTYRLRRGFVLLDPVRIDQKRFELAACLDGMEKPGIGRAVSIAQIRDEGLRIDMCATGGLVFNEQGVVIWEGQSLFEVQWALLQDIKALGISARVVAVAHACQVVDEAQPGMQRFTASKPGEVQCDYVVTTDRVIEVEAAAKPTSGVDFDAVDPDALNNIPPLQELKGIRTMEQIMAKGGFGQEKGKEKEQAKPLTAEEQMGMDIVAKLMKGYKA